MPSFLEVPSIISDQIPCRLYTISFAHITLHIHHCAFLFTRIHADISPSVVWFLLCTRAPAESNHYQNTDNRSIDYR